MPKCPHAPSAGTKAIKSALEKLHTIEHDLELANAITPTDHRLNEAEVGISFAIARLERVLKHPEPGEKWDCSKHGHVDNGGMFMGSCVHCGIDTDPL